MQCSVQCEDLNEDLFVWPICKRKIHLIWWDAIQRGGYVKSAQQQVLKETYHYSLYYD